MVHERSSDVDNCKKRIIQTHLSYRSHWKMLWAPTELNTLALYFSDRLSHRQCANCCVVANQTMVPTLSHHHPDPLHTIKTFPPTISPHQLHQHIISLAKFPTTIILASEIAFWSIATIAVFVVVVNSPKWYVVRLINRCMYSTHPTQRTCWFIHTVGLASRTKLIFKC